MHGVAPSHAKDTQVGCAAWRVLVIDGLDFHVILVLVFKRILGGAQDNSYVSSCSSRL